MPLKQIDKKANKKRLIKNVYELFGKYTQIVIVTLENVGSNQVQKIRADLRARNGVLVIGKNTVIRKAIQLRMKDLPEDEEYDEYRQYGKPIPEVENLLSVNQNKVGYIFTNEPVFELKPRIESNKVAQYARAGMIAPCDVIIPPGPTGMDPSMIGFFHALQISTKITKGQIEIAKDYQVCTKGKKVGTSEIQLLSKMNMKPFWYNMKIVGAYDNGAILSEEVVSMSPDDIIKKFQTGVTNLTSLSMESGIPTELSIPHFISGAFKNLASIGFEIDYKFAQLEAAESVQQSTVQEVKEVEKVEEKKEEPEKKEVEEEENLDMGDMFGD